MADCASRTARSPSPLACAARACVIRSPAGSAETGAAADAFAAVFFGAAAKAGHAVLYLLLIALPLTGWYAASRLGVPVSFFGLHLPAIAAQVQGAPGLIADLHENAGTVILYLAGLHALMAIWHQFVLRDGTLQRMSLR